MVAAEQTSFPPGEADSGVLILGLGNDILTDDAIGLHVARVAHDQLAGEPGIEVRATTEMGLALLDEISGRSAVVLVDSVQTGRAPAGHIHEIEASTLARVSSTTPHMLGVGETLSLGRLLGLPMPRQVRAFAIEVSDPFSLGTELTPLVRAAVGPAAARVVAAARNFASDAPSADRRPPATARNRPASQ
jgi:hydrogenase maturation protease